MEKIGLIAGNRKLPLVFSAAAKSRGYGVVAVAIKGETAPKLKRLVDKIYWIGLADFRRLFEIFKSEGINKIVMAGQISPHRLFSKEVDKDEELKSLLTSIKDKRADTIFGRIAERLKEAGFQLLDSTLFLGDLLPKKGTLTRRTPTSGEWEDIYFGLSLAKAVADLDIGQTVAVKGCFPVAVEALEGTDNLIRRAGSITSGGITVVKVSKPRQDMRFDMPVVGLNTIKNLIRAGARCLAIEADKTIFIDQQESTRLADKKNIAIVAL